MGSIASLLPSKTDHHSLNSVSYVPFRRDAITISDIVRLKRVLRSKLPIEIIDVILDCAEYWASSSVKLCTHHPNAVTTPNNTEQAGTRDTLYLRSLPLGIAGTEGNFVFNMSDILANEDSQATWELQPPSLPMPQLRCRKIVISLLSHDQGWGGTENPKHSWSWFDLSKETVVFDETSEKPFKWSARLCHGPASDHREHFNDPFTLVPIETPYEINPPSDHLQRNIVARRKSTCHEIILRYTDTIAESELTTKQIDADDLGRGWRSMDGSFVRGLKVGECVTIWARARFPGWLNVTEEATITLYWAL